MAHQPTEQGRGVIGITKVKAKGAFHIRLLGNGLNVKGFFPPFLINQAIHNAPTPKASHFVAPGVIGLHVFKNLQIGFIQPFITQVIGGCGENLTIRGSPAIMEFVCGVSLGILAGDLTKEPLPDPVFFIPRVEGQRDLLEQAGFRWNSTTDGFIKHIKIRFIHDFVCFLNPAPAQITNFNGDGSNLQGIIKAPEIDFLAGWLIGHFKGAFLDLPICLNPKAVDCPFQFSETGIFQGSEHLTNNKGIGFRVFHHSLDDVQGRGFGFL